MELNRLAIKRHRIYNDVDSASLSDWYIPFNSASLSDCYIPLKLVSREKHQIDKTIACVPKLRFFWKIASVNAFLKEIDLV